jgi:ABC-type multidrug transport system ATPase subunit
LHFDDIKTFLKAFDALLDRGHTLIIIEHNPEVIKNADWVIDLGPEGGSDGGNLVFAGTPEELVHCEASYTAKYVNRKTEEMTTDGKTPITSAELLKQLGSKDHALVIKALRQLEKVSLTSTTCPSSYRSMTSAPIKK